ncbi:MAG: serine/threonine-protein kinase, partial [Verrucomicrobiota bacterium]
MATKDSPQSQNTEHPSANSFPNSLNELPADFGPFRLQALICSRSEATLYEAHDSALDRPVAIKILSPSLAQDPAARDHFLGLARSLARLQHDNIMPVLNVHQDTPLPCFTMPLYDGETLEKRLEEDGPLPFMELFTLAQQITAALVHSHDAGTLHRSLTPANIFLEFSPQRARLIDFGVSQFSNKSPLDNPHLHAPEQLSAPHTNTIRTNLYSLGLVLHAAATGQLPFQPHSTHAVLHEPPPRIDSVPDWFADLIQRLLSKNPSKRPQNAHEVLRLLNTRSSRTQGGGAITLKDPLVLTLIILGLTLASLAIWKSSSPGPTEEPSSSPDLALAQLFADGNSEITIPSGIHLLAPTTLPDRP